jgi:uncharacterized RDD family membrane protein YckC
MLDTLRRVETPEGVELSLPVAGPVARVRAWFYDLFLKFGLLWIAAVVAPLFGQAGFALYLILVFLLTWLYPVVFEVMYAGATPGKRLVGLRVVHDDGMPVGWSASMIRSIVGFVDMLPFGYAIGLIASLFSVDFKRLGDLAAGTVVIYSTPAGEPLPTIQLAPVRPPFPLQIEEQRGIVEFALRSGRLTKERQQELANIAGPLVPAGDDAVKQLLAQARWIAGDR